MPGSKTPKPGTERTPSPGSTRTPPPGSIRTPPPGSEVTPKLRCPRQAAEINSPELNKKVLLSLLFERPREPVILPKGPENVVFGLPSEHWLSEHTAISEVLTTKIPTHHKDIKLKEITPPTLDNILKLRRDENFSHFIPKHLKIAGELINIFLGAKDDLDELLALAVYIRDRVNSQLFVYCYSVALQHIESTKDVSVPSLIQCFPDLFLDSKAMSDAKELVSFLPQGHEVHVTVSPKATANDMEVEHRVAYFREDLGVNHHHWHWHLVFPHDVDNFPAHRALVDKDRRGELFYYMHRQFLARYNFERLSNKLLRVEPFRFDSPIEEAYFPKLRSDVASQDWPAREANNKVKNLYREQDRIFLDVADMQRWTDRILEAIDSGKYQNEKGEFFSLKDSKGIDVLGNIVESCVLSPNRDLYGDLHNMGHVIISLIHDPQGKNLAGFGVMGATATAMRDPAFFKWHLFIDNIFQKHKSTMPYYTELELNHEGVELKSAVLQTKGHKDPNVLKTYWETSTVTVNGLDFFKLTPVHVSFQHLQHDPFTYEFTIENKGKERDGICRIFLSPKYDECGNRWTFDDQRMMFIELDKFQVTLKNGPNKFTRESSDSSVAIPFHQIFPKNPTDSTSALSKYCGCGWPEYMLIPKGTPEGMPCQLFIMVSDAKGFIIPKDDPKTDCKDAISYCGLLDQKYPDPCNMGYPFDRVGRPCRTDKRPCPIKERVDYLEQFCTPNMLIQDVTIKFIEKKGN